MRISHCESNNDHLRWENDNEFFYYLTAPLKRNFGRCAFVLEPMLEAPVAEKIFFRELESVFTVAVETNILTISGLAETESNSARLKSSLISLQRNGVHLNTVDIHNPAWSSGTVRFESIFRESTATRALELKNEEHVQRRMAKGFRFL
jgi:hypothetical protein